MTKSRITTLRYPFQATLAYFIVGAPLVNLVALFTINDPLLAMAAKFFAFLYIIVTPGLFLLPFLTKRKFPLPLAICFSVTISILCLMLLGLAVNTLLPLFGNMTPLSPVPLMVVFDLFIFTLFILNAWFDTDSAIEAPTYNRNDLFLIIVSILIPILSFFGAIRLNNGASNVLTMIALGIVLVLLPMVLIWRRRTDESTIPILIYFIALGLLLMNSMRGWFITGHDILLEYHVFDLTNRAHLWSMDFYRDPYNACLSLTILPTYLQNLLHVQDIYIFKFFMQFIGAFPAVAVYYFSRKYVSASVAFLVAFVFISFPTFIVDMSFLNRQGIAFLFFAMFLFTLLITDYTSGRARMILLFLLGTGIVLSHYSTSYITVALLGTAYLLGVVARLLFRARRPAWLVRFTSKLPNREIYDRPLLLTLPIVVGLFAIMIIWSTLITKTSKNILNTLTQISDSLTEISTLDESTGPAKYSLVQTEQRGPQQLFDEFLEQGLEKSAVVAESEFYPESETSKYETRPVAEILAPMTSFGTMVDRIVPGELETFFYGIKQTYAKVIQIFLIIGLALIIFGYHFRRNLLHQVPMEYLTLSIGAIIVMVGQTILPANAIEYGLLRLFQQNLIFLSLVIVLGFLVVLELVFRKKRLAIAVCCGIFFIFFGLLSGFFTQLTGGARPLLSLNNAGLYYDSYFTHIEEVYGMRWTTEHADNGLPIQAAHFSDIKMVAYGKIAPRIDLLPQTTRRNAYVYLNYDNIKASKVIEVVGGDVVYYYFPLEFLRNNKNLIYNNGGSEVYR
jgi:uncharacterized membrane protein